jgi:hypothetical protein
MDALEFIASIIGSLAWPGVVLVVLWCNRQRLASLPDWIEELTLPGGTKVKFIRALASAEAKLSASEAPTAAQVEGHADTQSSPDVIAQFPEAIVVQSFIEIVETCGQMLRFLPLPTKGRDPEGVVRGLAHFGYIKGNSVDLFLNLQEAYTAAVRRHINFLLDIDRKAASNRVAGLRPRLLFPRSLKMLAPSVASHRCGRSGSSIKVRAIGKPNVTEKSIHE